MSHEIQAMRHESQLTIADSSPNDRQFIYDLLMNSGLFGKEDADCVDDMFRSTWAALAADPNADTYHWLSCWHENTFAGYACYGTESLTDGTWDLFWICVAPSTRGQGVGSQLLAEVLVRAKQHHARLMVIYTSSTEAYAPARHLYESKGFTQAAVVNDYYHDGDHLYIYSKRLN